MNRSSLWAPAFALLAALLSAPATAAPRQRDTSYNFVVLGGAILGSQTGTAPHGVYGLELSAWHRGRVSFGGAAAFTTQGRYLEATVGLTSNYQDMGPFL